MGDFLADPRWQLDRLILVAELHLGDQQATILAREDIDFPGQVADRHVVSDLLNDRALAQFEQLFGIGDGNIVFEPLRRRDGCDVFIVSVARLSLLIRIRIEMRPFLVR